MKLSQGSCVFSVQNGIVGGGCKRNGGISKQRNSLVLLQAFMGGKKDDVQISGSGNVDEGKCLRAVQEVESTGLGDGKIQGRFEDNEGNERGFSLGYT